LEFGFVIFWRKEISKIALRKMWVKLAKDQNRFSCIACQILMKKVTMAKATKTVTGGPNVARLPHIVQSCLRLLVKNHRL